MCCGVGVGYLEAALLEGVAEIENRPADEEGALGIDDDPDVLGFHHDVAVGRAIDEIHFVLQPRAPATDDGNAKCSLLPALLAQKRREADSSLLGKFHELFVADLEVDRCRWIHRSNVQAKANQVNSASPTPAIRVSECAAAMTVRTAKTENGEQLRNVGSEAMHASLMFLAHLKHYADKVHRPRRLRIDIERLYEVALCRIKFAQTNRPLCTTEIIFQIARLSPVFSGLMTN
jgi:hypothetical protein